MTNRKFLSLLLALFMVFGTFIPSFAENDSVTVLPPRMAEKEEPDNIVVIEDNGKSIPIVDESKSEEGGKKIEETLEEPEIKEDNSPVILENREENNNIVILPPIKNEENEKGITEPSKETVEPEEPKKEKENKREVKVQILSKRDAKKPASEGEVNLILLNDNPADINEEVYDEKIRWKESDFKIEDDKIISLSDEGLLKVARNKKLEIPEMENITIIEKEAFKGLSLRSVEIPKNIKEIKDDAFKDNHLKSVKILGKGKEISKNAFNEELVEMYGKCEKEEFLYECEDELEIGEKIVGDALGAVAPDDVSLYTFSGTTITGLSEKGKTYYTDNHNMILPGRNPQGQAITEIGGNAFSNKWRGYGLRSVDFSKCTSLTDISYNAFYNNQITNLDLSRCTHLTNIRDDAFKQNHITSLDLSKCTGLTSIGDNAFESNELTSLNLSGCKNLKSIGINAFYSNQITNLDMSGCTSLTIVRGYAFSFNQLTSIDLSECTSLTSIGWNVFRGNQLTSLDLSECTSLTSIGDNTFVSNQLKTAKIPLSLKNLADNSFKDNPGSNDKKQVYLYTPDKTNPNNLQDSDFHLINPITGPDDVSLYTFNGTTITGLSEKGKTYYTNNHNMVLPGKNPQGQAITAIGEGAFQHNRLSSLDFSRCTSLTTIGSYAFCSNFLLALDLSGCTSLTNIGHYAFRDNKLKTAKIPLSLSILSEFAFKDNPGNNYNKQVYLFTPDYTNPNNLRGSSYHLINPAEGIYDVSLYTFSGTTITGLSEKGKTYYATNHNMILPGKNPRGQAVTAIESEAFYNGRKGYGLTSVDFSYCTSLTSIGRNAFNFSQLTSLDLSKCTKLKNIGDYAFNKNKLTNLDLSRCTRLASIGEGAFCENQLTSLDLSRCTSLTNIGPGAFYQNKLTSLDLSRCTSLTSIGPTAFCRNQLTSLDLSGCTSLTSIGISAFTGSKLKTAKIPLSLATLSDDAFKENLGNNDKKQVYLYTPDYTNPNNLKDTDYHLINPVESSGDVTLYTFNGATITGLSERGKKYFAEHHDMKLPGKNPEGQAITDIGEEAFSNNGVGYGLTSIDFANCTSLKSIRRAAFSSNNLTSLNLSGCTNLVSISGFSENHLEKLDLSGCTNLRSIDDWAFYRNYFTSLDLSECTSLTSIGSGAFMQNHLKTTKIPLSLKTLADNAFEYNPGNNTKRQVYLYTPDYTNPNNLQDTSSHLINPLTGSGDITLYTFNGTTITGLSERGKKYYATNHSMILPGKNPQGQAITEIGERAFYNSGRGYGLTSVDFSKCTSLISIETLAFDHNKLTNLDLSRCTNLTSIGGSAFNSNQLTNLNLSGCTNLTSVNEWAFYNNKLKSLDLSKCKNLISIGDYAFGENQLKTAKISSSITSIEENSFISNQGNNANNQVYLYTPDYTNPNNLKDSDYHLINPVESSDDVTLYTFDGTTITGLSERGKKYFETHHDMILPGKNPEGQAITMIRSDAFYKDGKGYGLTSVDFSNCTSLTTIGSSAFYNNKLTNLDLSRCTNLASIKYMAFEENQIASLDLSKCVNLASIGMQAFYGNQIANLDLSGCTSLTIIDEGAFRSNRLTNLNLSGCTGLSAIGDSAFYQNKLTSLNLSKCTSLTSIGYGTFGFNQLVNLDLSMLANLVNIDQEAFSLNKLKTAKIPLSLTTLSDDAFINNPGNNDKKQVYLYTPDYTNPNNLKDTKYHLINPITGPDDLSLFTFEGTTLTGLTRRGENYYAAFDAPPLTLPGKNPQGELITKIADKAFSSEDRLYLSFKGINFSNCTGLKIIGENSFARGEYGTVDLSPCTNLEVIGEYAFYFSSAKTVNLSGLKKLKRIEMGAFSTFNKQNPVSNLNISGCTSLEYIGVNAFEHTKIKSLDLSDSVNLKEVGEDAFANHNIVSLNLSGLKNLTKIGMGAFRSEDGNLKNVNLSGCTGLEIIEKQAFGWAGLETIDLTPCANLKTIESQAFVYGKLKTAKIPLSLVNLANDAFMDNSGNNARNQVYLFTPDYTNPNNLKDSRYHLINPVEGSDDVTLYTFNGTTITGLSERGKKYFAEHHDMKLPGKNPQEQAITEIGKNAFFNNWDGYGLISVDFSSCTSLASIDDYAFSKNMLKTAQIPLSLTTLADNAFNTNPGSNAQHQVYLYTPNRNNPMNLKDSSHHLVDPITFTIKKVDAKGKPMEGVEFAFYKVDRPTPPAPPAPPQNGTSRTDDTELEISSENISPAVGGITMPDIELNLNPEGPRPEFFPDPKTVVGVKPIFLTVTTDKNGKAEVTLPYSPYFLAENKTIPGYSINKEVTQIDATTEGKIITYTDYEVSIKIPETGTFGIIPYILLALILVGSAYVVLRKKKEEK